MGGVVPEGAVELVELVEESKPLVVVPLVENARIPAIPAIVPPSTILYRCMRSFVGSEFEGFVMDAVRVDTENPGRRNDTQGEGFGSAYVEVPGGEVGYQLAQVVRIVESVTLARTRQSH